MTPRTLSDLFQSAFGTIVQALKLPTSAEASAPKDPAPRGRQNTARIAVVKSHSYGQVVLQSVGGENRFLGISPLEGTLYSVGQQGEEWVEWHPFLLETLTVYLPEYRFILIGSSGKQQGGKREYRDALFRYALDSVAVDGKLPIDVSFEFGRQSVGQLILKISKSLVDFHKRGIIHGDLKPSNIILAPHRPELMDHFNLSDGNISPGWTPDWSAPEQVLGEPVSFTSDVYPMGRLLSELLSGYLVGEVRKFKTPPLSDGRDEFDIFYNPSVYIGQENGILPDASARRAWLSFIKSCLRFRQEERPTADLFAERLAELLQKFPLSGDVCIATPSNLLAAIQPDGEEVVARVVEVLEYAP